MRDRQVLLYPEGAVELNDSAAATLALVDGQRTAAQIVAVLRESYSNDQIEADVEELLADARHLGLVLDVDP